jgi:excisionase family DNA binding protein
MTKLLSVSEVAEFLGIRKTTVYKYVMRQRIPHVKIGARLLFDQARIEAWVKEQSREPRSPQTEERR